MKRAPAIAVACLISVASSWSAASREAGTRSAVFLRDAQGARAAGLGGAYGAAGRGVSAIFWNPAGMAGARTLGVTANHNLLIEGTRSQSLGALYPLPSGGGVIGFSALHMKTGDIERRDQAGALQGSDQAGGGTYSIAWAFQAGDHGFGLNLKRVEESLGADSGSTWAVDAGLRMVVGGLQCALSLQNTGGPLEIAGTESPLPTTARVGVAREGIRTLLAADLEKPSDGRPAWRLGGEYRVGALLSLRAGYAQAGRFDPSSGLSFGLGINSLLGGGAVRGMAGAEPLLGRYAARLAGMTLDYAYVMRETFDPLHRLSVTFEF